MSDPNPGDQAPETLAPGQNPAPVPPSANTTEPVPDAPALPADPDATRLPFSENVTDQAHAARSSVAMLDTVAPPIPGLATGPRDKLGATSVTLGDAGAAVDPY